TISSAPKRTARSRCATRSVICSTGPRTVTALSASMSSPAFFAKPPASTRLRFSTATSSRCPDQPAATVAATLKVVESTPGDENHVFKRSHGRRKNRQILGSVQKKGFRQSGHLDEGRQSAGHPSVVRLRRLALSHQFRVGPREGQ